MVAAVAAIRSIWLDVEVARANNQTQLVEAVQQLLTAKAASLMQRAEAAELLANLMQAVGVARARKGSHLVLLYLY